MRKFSLTLSVLTLCILSFLAGTAFNSLYFAKNTLEKLGDVLDMAIDPQLQLRRDIDLYEVSLESSSRVPKLLRFSILTKFDWGNYCDGEYCEQLNVNKPTYESNQLIIKYLDDYPVESCQSLAPKDRVKCNLELVP